MTANTPASRKAKGRAFQQAIRDDITSTFVIDPQDVQSTAMGQAGCDIYLSAAARAVFPFGVECKHQDTIRLKEWLQQCKANADKVNLHPLLTIKISEFDKNRPATFAVIEWGVFLDMMRMAARGRT